MPPRDVNPRPTSTPATPAAAPVTVTVFDPAPILEAIARLEAEVRELRRDTAGVRATIESFQRAPVASLLREKDVAALVGYSPRTLSSWIAAGKFPNPIRHPDEKLHSTKRWLRSEVEAWIAARTSER